MDVNPFEIAGKVTRRTHETVEDLYFAAQEGLWSEALQGLFFKPGTFSHGNSDLIIEAAKEALNHGDIEETAHQLRREIYFSSIFPWEAGSVNEIGARAGLEAIENHKPHHQIKTAIDQPIERILRGIYK